jgi:DNA polymerase-3 subunit alpha
MNKLFYNFHQHTSKGSVGDAICNVEDVVRVHKENNISHVCITEHGNINSFADLYFKCKENNIIPVAGIEAYVCDNLNDILKARDNKDSELAKKLYSESVRHLILIAYNAAGYKNLMNIVAFSADNFYNKPLITTEKIKQHKDGLIITSACIGGLIGKSYRKNNIEEAIAYAKKYKKIFGENFFLELTAVDVDNVCEYNDALIMLSKKLSIPCVISNDIHFVKKSDWQASYILHALRENLTLQDIQERQEKNAKSIKYVEETCKETYFKTYDELRTYWNNNLKTELFTDKVFDEAIENNRKIFVERVGNFIPNIVSNIPRPKETNFEDLVAEVIKGAKIRGIADIAQYRDRIAYEMEVIKKLKIDSYIDVLYDFVSWTKKNYGVTSMAPGRGSAAASLVLYCLGITEIDPIKHNLLFERFLDESKIESGSGPDVDLDFAQNVHEHVKKYIYEKYPNSIPIGTLQEYKWKSVIKDILRFYNVPFMEANELTKEIENDYEHLDFFHLEEVCPNMYRKISELVEDISILDTLHGTYRSSGKHPAGVVIGDKNTPLGDLIPYYHYNDTIVSGWDGDTLSDLGYYKYDLLRVTNVQVIDDSLSLIRKFRKCYEAKNGKNVLPPFIVKNSNGNAVDIDIYRDCGIDDKDVFNYANTTDNGYDCIFQFGTNTAKPILSRLKPSNFEHLVALNSILRPATIRYGSTETYIRRATGQERYTLHEKLQPILGDSYGIIIFQEQCMQLCMQIGDFSSKEANKVRKLLIKKSDIVSVKKYKDKFISNATEKIGSVEANRLWDEMERLSEYAFCRAHAVCYSIIADFDMWLKYYYGFEFYTSVLNNLGDKNIDKISEVINNINNKKLPFHVNGETVLYPISVLPPDINNPSEQFILDEQYHIRYGLRYIKGIMSKDLLQLVNKKSHFKTFKNFIDFTIINKFNKASVFSLIFCGACDVFNIGRNDMWQAYKIMTSTKDKVENFSVNELLNIEKDLIGINFDMLDKVSAIKAHHTLQYVASNESGKYEIAFRVKDIISKKTKKNKPYKMIIVDGGSFNIFVWELEEFEKDNITAGDIIRCVVSKNNGFVQFVSAVKDTSIVNELSGNIKYGQLSATNTDNKALIGHTLQMEMSLW